MVNSRLQLTPTLATGGFALLITLIVISVTLAIGLSLLNITVKQLSLSTTARDSELAFNAAQASVECAQMVVRQIDFLDQGAVDANFNCFPGAATNDSATDYDSSDGQTWYYDYEEDWDNGEQDVCSAMDIYILDARSAGSDYSVTFTEAGLTSEVCPAGDVCTVIFGQGYNRACNDLGGLRTVQREITISF